MTIVKPDLQKLENLLKSATNARQRKMYESLLAKARKKYQKVEPAPQQEEEPVSEIKPEAKVTSPTETKQKKQTTQKVKERKSKQQKQEIKQVKEEKITVVEPKTTKKNDNIKPPVEQPEDITLQQEKNTKKVDQLSQEKDRHLFQAVGLIRCSPQIKDDKLYITLDHQEYLLKRGSWGARKNFDNLKAEIEQSGSKEVKVRVYPKIVHNLEKQEICPWFSLIKLLPDKPQAENQQEGFILRGIWQYVPHCSKPVISIFRNIEMLYQYKKKSTPAAKKAFARRQDFPVLWSAPVEPPRYNPKLEKTEQVLRYFVQVRAIFKDGQFQVTEMIEEPTLDIPKYINPTRKNTKHPKQSSKSNKE